MHPSRTFFCVSFGAIVVATIVFAVVVAAVAVVAVVVAEEAMGTRNYRESMIIVTVLVSGVRLPTREKQMSPAAASA